MAERFNPTLFTGTASSPENAEFAADKYPGLILQVGAVPDNDNPGRQKEFRLVKLDSTMTVAPFNGAVGWWSDRPNGIVTTSPTNRRTRVAGVFCKAPTSLVNTAIYVQVRGRHPQVKFIDAVTVTPDATGRAVIPSATAGKADCVNDTTVSNVTYPKIGETVGTYDAINATCAVELDLHDFGG